MAYCLQKTIPLNPIHIALGSYWREVTQFLNSKLRTNIKLSPCFALLHISNNRLFLSQNLDSIPQGTEILITLFMSASKKALFNYWLKKETPSILDITAFLNQLTWQQPLKMKSI
ncbi:hypothetical protein XELAEV_18006845mg [Xenopus laevis]|uniref:Uncharacterized protein n=1 Tax=Xenopus laevis TaxID=8355 RepID=A0A974E0E6_XENLA|nr:hypothetical protein XELAEV_18006845mg [Xenopus laevis]